MVDVADRLRAAFALPLGDGEREMFRQIAGDRAPPSRVVRELWCDLGRRSGKRRWRRVGCVPRAVSAAQAGQGRDGHVLVLAATADQATTVFDYAGGFR